MEPHLLYDLFSFWWSWYEFWKVRRLLTACSTFALLGKLIEAKLTVVVRCV